MLTIGVLSLIAVGVSVAAEVVTDRLDVYCEFSIDAKELVLVNCTRRNLRSIPNNIISNVMRLDVRRNYIRKLSNDSFAMYPHIRILLLSFNQLRTIEAGSLAVLAGLETLDLSHNDLKEVPAGLPGSLAALYLDGNPLADIRNLDRASGLRVLGLNHGRLDEYPRPGLAPNLVELDLSDNYRIAYVDPVRLAGTCRLTKLNVTDINMFPGRLPGSHCRCRRFVQWALAYHVLLVGMDPCPKPLSADDHDRDRDRDDYYDDRDDRCAGPSDEARAVYDKCMDVRAAPSYRTKLVVVVVVVVFFVVVFFVVVFVVAAGSLCVRRRAANRTGLAASPTAELPSPASYDVVYVYVPE